MKLYESYIKESERGVMGDLILVKNGFSFSALLFNFAWFLYYGMWRLAAILFVSNILISSILKDFATLGLFGVIAISFGIGLNANYWLSKHLRNNNYKLRGCVFGRGREDAELKFIENFLADNKNSDQIYINSLLDDKKYSKKQKIIEKYFNRDRKDYFAIKKY